MGRNKTDCRSQVGITVGLIDSIISIARILSPRLKEQKDIAYGGAIYEALNDLTTDKDVMYIAGHHEASKIRPLTDKEIENRKFMERVYDRMKNNDDFKDIKL